MDRPEINDGEILFAVERLKDTIKRGIAADGSEAFASGDEILGTLGVKFSWLFENARWDDAEAMLASLYELAATAVFAAACIEIIVRDKTGKDLLKTENRRRKTEDGGQKTEDGNG